MLYDGSLTATIHRALRWAVSILLALNSVPPGVLPAAAESLRQDEGRPAGVSSAAPVPPSVVDIPIEQLVHEFPELKKLKPAASQESLSSILQKVGANVAALFNNFPNVTSREEVTEQRLTLTGITHDEIYQEFRYLALVSADKRRVGFQEYRTDSKGRILQRKGLDNGYLITQGFVSLPLHFHPFHQPDDRYRYLGQEVIKKRATDVVAFAQTARASEREKFIFNERTVLVLVQGVAWIDAENHQIVQMRTDLGGPVPEIRLDSQVTRVNFTEIRFKGGSLRLWLPREVEVETHCYGETFRNTHSYSQYKLFTVQTQVTPGKAPSRR